MGRLPGPRGDVARVLRRLRHAVPPSRAARLPSPADAIGVECEYGVWENGQQVDFRRILAEVAALSNVRLVRETADRYRRPDGLKLSCDGWHAELATPPEPLSPHAPSRVAGTVLRGRNWLIDLLVRYGRTRGRRYTISGYSTHFNVRTLPPGRLDGLARRVAQGYGPLLTFMTNLPVSGGILCRPRPGRLEIASECVTSAAQLRAAITVLVGSVLVAFEPDGRFTPPGLPEDRLRPSPIRYGWQLSPEGISPELRRRGRRAVVKGLNGDRLTVQTLLDREWTALVPHLRAHLAPAEIALAADFVRGRRRTALEVGGRTDRDRLGRARVRGLGGNSPRTFARALRSRRVGGWSLTPELVEWDFLVLGASRNGETPRSFLSVPGRLLREYASGRWDRALTRALPDFRRAVRRGARHTLTGIDQTRELGLFTDLDRRSLARDLEQPDGPGDKKKKKKKRGEPVCDVLVDENGNIEICMPEVADTQRVLAPQEPPQGDRRVARGIWVHSGVLGHERVDLRVRGRELDFAHERDYRSGIEYFGPHGYTWDHRYNVRIVDRPPPTARRIPGGWCERHGPGLAAGPLTFHHGTGRVTEHDFVSAEIRDVSWCGSPPFTAVVATYTQNDGESFEIQRYSVIDGRPPDPVVDANFFRVLFAGGTRYLLDCRGRLVEIRGPHGETTRCQYGLPFDPRTLCLVLRKVIGSLGDEYVFDYEVIGGAPLIVSITDPWQRQVRYAYDERAQLTRVTLVPGDAGTPEILYRYDPARRPGILTEIVNPVEAAGSQESWLENTYVTDPSGRWERVTRQRVGSPSAAPPAGGVYRILYPSPTLVTVVDREGARREYTLRPLGPTSVVEREAVEDETGTDGAVAAQRLETVFEYDQHYHFTRLVHPSGREERFTFRNRNAIVRQGDELDDVVRRIAHHNDLGRDALLRHAQIAAGGGDAFVTTYAYRWLFGAMTRISSPAGVTRLVYDDGRCVAPWYNANPIRITYPAQRLPDGGTLPVVETYDYVRGGIVTTFRDPDGVESVWDVNAAGLVTRFTVGGQVQAEFGYDPRGNVLARTDARGKRWTFSYDGRDLLRTVTDPLAHTTEFRYNRNDWRILTSIARVDDATPIPGVQPQPAAQVVDTFGYDILGNRTTHTERATPAAGAVTRTWRWTYDGEERELLVESPRVTAGERPDARVRTTYNARGLVRAVTTADGGADAGTTRAYYDEDGRTALVIDPLGQRTVTRYDGHGRPLTEEWPDGSVRHLEYRAARLWREWVEGPIAPRPPGLGATAVRRVLREVRFEVDAIQRPIRRAFRIFDPLQRPTIADPAGSSWDERTSYTPAGRLRRQEDPAGHRTTFDWNAQGQLETARLPLGHTVGYRYDGELIARVTTTLKPDAGVTGPLPPGDLVLEESRAYDDLGRLTTLVTPHGVMIEHAYDSLGNLRAKRTPRLQGDFTLTQYRYDGLSRRTAQTTDQVASLANPDGRADLAFEYDLNDNATALVDDLQQRTTATYDGRDLPITLDQPGQGSLVYRRRRDGSVRRIERAGGGTTLLDYTLTGQVARAVHRGAGATVRQAFGYDGLGRLLWATDSNGGAQFRVQVYRALDSLGRVITERTAIPEYGFDKAIEYDYEPGRRGMLYPDGIARLVHEIGGDGNAKRISLSGAGVVREASHQGPGRVLQTLRDLTLRVDQPAPRRFDLTLRTSERYDPQGRLAFRALHVTDPINRPGAPAFLPFGTQAERTSYETSGLPRRRDYGVITQPGVSVDSTFVYDGLGQTRVITEGEGQDFLNTDYDWDGAGRLNLVELNGRQAGQIVDESTTITYQPGRRIDRRRVSGSLVTTTTWDFDGDGRLTQSSDTQTGDRRTFAYDAADRLTRVDVFTPGLVLTGQATSRFLYDALGRLVVRVADDMPEFFLYDQTSLVEEFDGQQQPTRRYVYDERQQLVHYGFRDPDGAWQTYYPLLTADGAPWILVAARPELSELPPPPGATAAAVTRAAYYRENLPIIVEEYRWRPFERGVIIRYDYAGGTATGSAVETSLLPVDSGGRRLLAGERLLATGARFHDPALRAFITLDSRGAWGHATAYGNARSYAGNNPIAFGDDGSFPVLVGVLIVVAAGALIGAGLNAARQGVQILEGSRSSFSFSELGLSALLGGALAPALVFAPELAVPAIAVGLGTSVYQRATGQIGNFTLAFDVATMGVPFLFPGVRGAAFGRGTVFGQMRGLGPAASFGDRAGRFSQLGSAALARFGRTRSTRPMLKQPDTATTADMLEALGGRQLETRSRPPTSVSSAASGSARGCRGRRSRSWGAARAWFSRSSAAARAPKARSWVSTSSWSRCATRTRARRWRGSAWCA